ncbi:MPT63 family protein [Mycobacterium botniense]|uniref:MPT63-like domain-containing protein n=1 Tax=Mycobacterium botniense TaxID=84962 RepID=A0A7I9Y325_9MYCO|nr:MPT63 family protein [Mycobacterium botniense]GFG76479.1 hypothetical protein MBOT_38440 [Mycobacterium botniense]
MRCITTAVKTATGAAALAAAGVFTAATAAAQPAIQKFGTAEQLFDGPMVTAYTVSHLQPSTAVLPGYTPAGKLYQADVTARSDGGTVTPLISDFNARAANGQTYRVIDTVPAPDGISPAPLVQGEQSSGKIYFDVTGAPPDGVVYNDGVQDVLIWTT